VNDKHDDIQFTEIQRNKNKQQLVTVGQSVPSMFFLTWLAIPELSGYRVSSRSAGKNKSEPFAFCEEAEEEGSSGTEQKQDSNGRRHFFRKGERQLTEEQAVELGLLDLVAAVFELHVSGCDEERAAERE
jgi:hypothetical protein